FTGYRPQPARSLSLRAESLSVEPALAPLFRAFRDVPLSAAGRVLSLARGAALSRAPDGERGNAGPHCRRRAHHHAWLSPASVLVLRDSAAAGPYRPLYCAVRVPHGRSGRRHPPRFLPGPDHGPSHDRRAGPHRLLFHWLSAPDLLQATE